MARVAERGRRDNHANRDLAVASTVSVYVGAEDAEAFLALIERARQAVDEAVQELQQKLASSGATPAAVDDAVDLFLLTRRLPRPQLVIPRGAVVRLAVERWQSRSPADVVAAGEAWGLEHHQQIHRSRRDMRTVSRLRP